MTASSRGLGRLPLKEQTVRVRISQPPFHKRVDNQLEEMSKPHFSTEKRAEVRRSALAGYRGNLKFLS